MPVTLRFLNLTSMDAFGIPALQIELDSGHNQASNARVLSGCVILRSVV
jgi:hypothetical protein